MVYRICFVLQLLLNREMYGRTKQSSNQDVVFITFRCNEKITLNNLLYTHVILQL